MQLGRDILLPSTALLLGILPLIAAHGDDAHSSMNMGGVHHAAMSNATKVAEAVAPSYFRHTEYAGWIYAHIGLMVIAWVVILPIGEQKPRQIKRVSNKVSNSIPSRHVEHRALAPEHPSSIRLLGRERTWDLYQHHLQQ